MGQLILVILTCEVRNLSCKMSKSKTKLEQLLMVAMLTLAGTGTCFYLPNRNKNVESDCLSQDNKPGVCTEITNCQTLGDFFEKPITKEKRNFLESFTCGFANDVPKICCPIDTRSISVRRTITTTPTTTISTTATTQTTTTTTESFRITEETTKHDPATSTRHLGTNLRRGFNEWGVTSNKMCSSEFCKEAFGLK